MCNRNCCLLSMAETWNSSKSFIASTQKQCHRRRGKTVSIQKQAIRPYTLRPEPATSTFSSRFHLLENMKHQNENPSDRARWNI